MKFISSLIFLAALNVAGLQAETVDLPKDQCPAKMETDLDSHGDNEAAVCDYADGEIENNDMPNPKQLGHNTGNAERCGGLSGTSTHTITCTYTYGRSITLSGGFTWTILKDTLAANLGVAGTGTETFNSTGSVSVTFNTAACKKEYWKAWVELDSVDKDRTITGTCHYSGWCAPWYYTDSTEVPIYGEFVIDNAQGNGYVDEISTANTKDSGPFDDGNCPDNCKCTGGSPS